jgi:diguanylate cyclase (GGDEF)-like protein
MVLRFEPHGREHGQEAEEEPQAPTPRPEQRLEPPEGFQPAKSGETNEPTQAAGSEAPAVSDKLPLAEGTGAARREESTTGTAEKPTPASPSPKHIYGDCLSLMNALLRLHGAEDIDSLADAADQLARTYLNGAHLLVLVVDRGGAFHLRAAKSGATATLLEQLNDALGIDVGLEIPFPHRGRLAKIWLDETGSAQAVSLADFWGGLAGEETCWRAEKVLGISQVTAIRLASPEEPLGIALLLSKGDPPDPAMLDAIGRHLMVALTSLQSIEKARQFGSVDPVRWIPDHSEFTRQLSREVSRARRYDQPVSMALLVVDNFDTLRLEYGWTVANRLLRAVSSALAECLRESDFLGSYRHNGFGAILTQTSVEGASEAVVRLRETAAGVRVLEGEDSPVPECVVASASLPNDGDDASALLLAAESRLLPKRRLSSAAA